MKNLIVIALLIFPLLAVADFDAIALVPDVSLDQAAKDIIADNNVNRVLSARTIEREGKKFHVIKMLTKDGHILQQSIEVDPATPVDINNH